MDGRKKNEELRKFTEAFYTRLPPELRTLTYNFVLDENTGNEVEWLQCSTLPSFYSKLTRHVSPTKNPEVVIDLHSMHTPVAGEIAGHFHTKFKNNRVIGAANIASFLQHDFLGMGVRPADVPICGLTVHLEIEDPLPTKELPDAFEALLKPEQKWAKNFRLRILICTELAKPRALLDYLCNETRAMLSALGSVVARAEERGGKVKVDFGVFWQKADGSSCDKESWKDVYGCFVRDGEEIWREKFEKAVPEEELW
ncbi:hypothetical protein K458DRAFT_72522 [Lentithecium fluviatile CBS 122367]|uniref:Uncharacterized protein n=1 Tax=Lentithecium fluviatile CBS 122367 TaxID=1168545 RepID=A0A6G1IVI5_9PLEO|nr:hypothetical protein K458DRAFT_72522 [Lentithecium fluviatile CBS 122367]